MIEQDGEMVPNPAYDEGKIAELEAKISEIEADIEAKQGELEEKQAALEEQQAIVEEMTSNIEEATAQRDEIEAQKQQLEEELNAYLEENDQENYEKLVEAQQKYNDCQEDYETTYNNEYQTINNNCREYSSEIQKVNQAIEAKKAQEVAKENTVKVPNNAMALYKSMGLEELGLNYDVFELAMEGYGNLENKGNGLLGIFDTTQGANEDRYYLIDMENMEVIGQCEVKTGSGDMSNILTANREGSHATLSGFEMVGEEYYSPEMGKEAMRLIGLEEGINDNALSKGTVVHYTTGNSTWGCMGFDPVMSNGSVDVSATNEKMRQLFPQNTIIFTNPTDPNYRNLSSLVA